MTKDEQHTLQALSVSYISHKFINNGTIRPSSPCASTHEHDDFIPQYRFSHGRLSSPKAPHHPKTISAENQRYLPENTADSSSSPVYSRPSSTTPSTHTTPVTLVTLSLHDSHGFDTRATPDTPVWNTHIVPRMRSGHRTLSTSVLSPQREVRCPDPDPVTMWVFHTHLLLLLLLNQWASQTQKYLTHLTHLIHLLLLNLYASQTQTSLAHLQHLILLLLLLLLNQ